MSYSSQAQDFVRRHPAASALVTLVAAAAVVMTLTKSTPTGLSADRNIACWATTSGGTIACIGETGTGALKVRGSMSGYQLTVSGFGGNANGIPCFKAKGVIGYYANAADFASGTCH
jgi:hypothetical protein